MPLVDSTLIPYSICGTISTVCPDEPRDMTVTVDLVNPAGGTVRDPSNDSYVVVGRVHSDTVVLSEDGCWCTCPLLPNFATDSEQALLPNTTYYKIVVRWGATIVLDQIITLGADDLAALPLDTSPECGDCINIASLLDAEPILPAPATFCEVVDACVAADLDALEAADVALEAAALAAQTTADAAQTAADAAQVGVDANTAAIAAFVDTDTFATAVENADGSITITNADGAVVIIPAPSDADTLSTLTENPDGSFTHDDGAGNTTDIPAPEPCEFISSATDPATGGAVVITITDGATVYTLPDGSAFAGDPTTLV